eukprot:5957571-Amphidinium_carterae.7
MLTSSASSTVKYSKSKALFFLTMPPTTVSDISLCWHVSSVSAGLFSPPHPFSLLRYCARAPRPHLTDA